MVDAFDAVDAAYSFGIGDNVAWDKEIAQRAIPVHMYDHTIDQLPENTPISIFSRPAFAADPTGQT